MANFMKVVVSNYNDILESTKDPMVNQWLLMSSPGPVLLIVGVYLLFVLKIGPKMMESRPPFQLTNLLILYNGLQVLFSIWLATLAFKVDFFSYMFTKTCNSGARTDKNQQYMLAAAWWYFFSKIIELLDTVFFVMRKKQNQVTFLHVYHHSITALFSWCYLRFLPGEQGLLIGFLNSSVHIVMYTYYLIAALGPQYKKYLWWKKYMTWIQLIQFGIMLVYLMSILVMDCPLPKTLTYFFVTNVVIFIYLFSDFYRKAYTKNKAMKKET